MDGNNTSRCSGCNKSDCNRENIIELLDQATDTMSILLNKLHVINKSIAETNNNTINMFTKGENNV